jgi:HAMP domain-containing protein
MLFKSKVLIYNVSSLKREFEIEKRDLVGKYEIKLTERNNEIDKLKQEIEKMRKEMESGIGDWATKLRQKE